MKTDKVLVWLKDFKKTWLLQNIFNDTHLIELISNKLHELEQLVIQEHPDENEVTNGNEVRSAISEAIVLSNEQRSLPPTPPDIHQSAESEEIIRPAIRLKRISLADAERFLPLACQIPKSKRGRKKSQKNLSAISSTLKKKKKSPTSKSTTQDETPTTSTSKRRSTRVKKLLRSPSVPNTQATNGWKEKRKLRAINGEDDDLCILANLSPTENFDSNNDCEQVSRYLGQNGILSQTRKTNETLPTNDDDFPIKLNSRQFHPERNNDVTSTEIMRVNEDIAPLDGQQMLESDSLFSTLESIHEKNREPSLISNNKFILNYDDCIEDISNDAPPSSSLPNFDHLPLTE